MITYPEFFFNNKYQNSNCICLYSKDQFNISKVLSLLSGTIPFPELNIIKESSDDLKNNISSLVEQCETIPFMSPKRLVIINAKILEVSDKIDKTSNKFIKGLCQYIPKLPNTTILILYFFQKDKRENIKKNNNILKLEKAGALVITNSKVQRTEAANITIEFSAINNLNLDKDIIRYLSEIDNLDLLNNELNKLIFLDKPINLSMVKDVVSYYDDSDIFNLTDALSKNKALALKIYQDLLDKGKAPISILYMLLRQFKLLYYCKLAKERKFTSDDTAIILKVHPFVCKTLFAQADNFSINQLERKMDQCLILEIKIKSQPLDAKQELEMILF